MFMSELQFTHKLIIPLSHYPINDFTIYRRERRAGHSIPRCVTGRRLLLAMGVSGTRPCDIAPGEEQGAMAPGR